MSDVNMIELSDIVVIYRFEWSIMWLCECDVSDLMVTYWFEWPIVWLSECDWVEWPSDLVVNYWYEWSIVRLYEWVEWPSDLVVNYWYEWWLCDYMNVIELSDLILSGDLLIWVMMCDYVNVIELSDDLVVTYRFEWSIVWLYEYE